MIRERLSKLFFPVNCLNCESESDWLCETCLANIPLTRDDICVLCHKYSEENNLCLVCQKELRLDGVVSLYPYNNQSIRSVIKVAKYIKQFDAIRYLSNKSRPDIWLRLPREKWQLIPIPLHKTKLKTRGFNQAEIIADEFSLKDNKVSNILTRTIETIAQAELPKEERKDNVRNCFTLKSQPPTTVLLIDDVFTTGSTLKEAAKVLRKAGTKKIWAVTLAHG